MMTFNIGEIHRNTPHLFADVAELLLLTGACGKSFLHTNDLESLIKNEPISTDEFDEEECEEKLQQSSADKNSRQDRQLEDVMSQLDYRSKSFNNFYPFHYHNDTLRLSSGISEPQRVYRFLLACSRLRSFQKKGLPQLWAKQFAKLSQLALAGLQPMHATTRIFDANSDDRKSHYGTDLRIALKKLGEELGVLKINEDECQNAGSSGDAGYDLISSFNFDDGAATAFAILGQCGAQETGWPKKTLEAHSMKLRNYFQLLFDYPSVMFTPVCYRTATGGWVDNKCANGIFLADRLRTLMLLEKQKSFSTIIIQQWFIDFEDQFLKFKY